VACSVGLVTLYWCYRASHVEIVTTFCELARNLEGNSRGLFKFARKGFPTEI